MRWIQNRFQNGRKESSTSTQAVRYGEFIMKETSVTKIDAVDMKQYGNEQNTVSFALLLHKNFLETNFNDDTIEFNKVSEELSTEEEVLLLNWMKLRKHFILNELFLIKIEEMTSASITYYSIEFEAFI
ncbi:hypothetical protein HHI36_009535 [Cryptolaemus montrouzieri]|uniref:Uncharacterized protein n=1 Tax=Cryptolaemus montrouzieri TaxID=559131 RepID=A0ABD2MFZ5_9CUCU